MTRYNKLIARSDRCLKKAFYYLKQGEDNLYHFFLNAASGFRIKACNLTVEEGEQDAE